MVRLNRGILARLVSGHAWQIIAHVRRQHPIGQGFFHSAAVNLDASPGKGTFSGDYIRVPVAPSNSLSYVYDCGELRRRSVLQDEIDRFKCDRVGAVLDFLFVSHFHHDHTNGLERLLSGLTVSLIVIPYTSAAERLMSYAESLRSAPAAAVNPIAELIASPEAAFQRMSPGVPVVNIAPARFPDDDFAEDDLTQDDVFQINNENTPDGSGDLTWSVAVRGAADGRSVATGSNPIVVSIANQRLAWQLHPFVPAESGDHRAAFELELSRRCRRSWAEIELELTSDGGAWIVRNRRVIRAAYDKVVGKGRTNVTSLCLYSGPVGHEFSTSSQSFGGQKTCSTGSDAAVGWVGTGDAELDAIPAQSSFVKWAERFSQDLGTITLPHHGSRNNWSINVLRKLERVRTVVVSAHPPRNWRHPHPDVLEELLRHGLEVRWVRRDLASRHVQFFRVR